MNVSELLELIFGGEAQTVYIFDNAETIEIKEFDPEHPEIDEDELLLKMPDAELDLYADGLVYAVATDLLPLEDAHLIVNGHNETFGIFLLQTPVKPDLVPDNWDTAIPIGLGWEIKAQKGGLCELDDLLDFNDDLERDHVQDTDTDSEISVETAVEDDTVGEPETAEKDSEPEMMNDAVILGKDHPDLEDFLCAPANLATGQLYGAKDRRNTRDNAWKNVELTWLQWLNEGGLSKHPVAKDKGGDSIVPAKLLDGKRTDAAVETMYAVGIDIDSGTKLTHVVDKLVEAGYFALVYTTFSHLKTKLELKHDAVVKAMKLDDTPTRTQIQEYLRLHHKDRYDRDFISEIKVINAREHTSDGLMIILETPAIDKYRVILPLAKPVHLSDLAPTMQGWKEVWADAVTGVAVNMLDADFDASCSDVNRLFYTPRHPKGGEFYSAIVLGKPLPFDEIEPASKEQYVRSRKATGDPFTYDDGDQKEIQSYQTPSGMSLNDWHKKVKDRFLIADVLETYASDKLRSAGGEKVGTVHLECPFEHEHSTHGGTATMAMNPDANSEGYWTIFCRHDACSGRHKLEFLQQMLADEWFDESVLTDESFVLPPSDQDMDDDEPEEEAPTRPAVEEAEQLNEASSETEIEKFIKRHHKLGVDKTTRNALTEVLARRTKLGKRDIGNIWKTLDAEKARKQSEAAMADLENFDGFPVVNLWDAKDMIKWAKTRIEVKNAEIPFLFHYMDGVARVSQNSEGFWRIRLLAEPEFAAELNKLTTWNHQVIMGEQVRNRGVLAPKDIVQHLYSDMDAVYPPLRAVTASPSFTSSGSLISVPGYDPSGIYYQPDITLDIPEIAHKPTSDDIMEAKRLLIEEILADFPFGGKVRDEIVEECLHGEGIPAVTHVICMLLLFFCRDMIEGPTPGHLVGKPTPGTGASLLAETLSIIGTGDVVPASELPPNKEELQKSITAFLVKGSPMIFYDNINHTVDSGGLAMALTSSRHEARILGKTQTVDTPVRCIWVLTGNNVQLSGEILRRCLLIDMDAQMAEPEKRSGWRHDDIRAWARENRGKLVWACLTLIQNWIAKGKVLYRDEALNSYENWSSVMGGIMRDADIGGFLGNRDELKAMSSDGKENEIVLLLEDWWEEYGATWVQTRMKQEDDNSLLSLTLRRDIQLNIRKQKTADETLVYNAQQFEAFLTRYQNRVFQLADGTQVCLNKSMEKDKYGYKWMLEPKVD